MATVFITAAESKQGQAHFSHFAVAMRMDQGVVCGRQLQLWFLLCSHASRTLVPLVSPPTLALGLAVRLARDNGTIYTNGTGSGPCGTLTPRNMAGVGTIGVCNQRFSRHRLTCWKKRDCGEMISQHSQLPFQDVRASQTQDKMIS